MNPNFDRIPFRTTHCPIDWHSVTDVDWNLRQDLLLPFNPNGRTSAKTRGVNEYRMASAQIDKATQVDLLCFVARLELKKIVRRICW